MADLVPSHLGFEEITGSKPRQRLVTNISEWLQAFAVHEYVISKKQPQRVPDSMGYQILMLEVNSTLWSLAFTGQAKASCCKHCFSLFHQSSDCEFAPAYSFSHAKVSARRRFICLQWNEQSAQRCMFPNCRYEHMCYNCAFDLSVRDIHHKANFCPNTPAQQPVPLQRPRPLFQ